MKAVYLCAAAVLLSANVMASEIGNQSFQTTITKTVGLKYSVCRPDGYNENADKKWPLILFLHGAGERGDDLSVLRPWGPLGYSQKTPGFGFIVVAPQCPTGEDWDPDTVIALLDKVQEDYRVDPDRAYLTGLSMGGIGTWETAIAHPGRFAALAPVCGRGVPLLGYRIYQMPIWVFHGEKDDVIDVCHSREMVDALKGMGGERIKFTVYPEGGHDIWNEVYNNPELYDWFLKYKRGNSSE